MVFNSIVSTPEAKFMTIDIINIYLNTSLQEYQYMRFNINMMPQEVINHYELQNEATDDGWVHCEIRKAIYGFKESRKLANIDLRAALATEGYKSCRFTHGLYKHKTQNVAFSFVVNDFLVKYINKKDADHLMMTLQKKYPIKINLKGDYYLGITLEWNYHKIHSERNVWLSMPGYVKEALIEFKRHFVKQQFSASPFQEPVYGSKVQYADIIEIPIIIKKQIHILQQICGKFLYYAWTIDSTMMHALNVLALQVAAEPTKTEEAQACFLNYCATNPDALECHLTVSQII